MKDEAPAPQDAQALQEALALAYKYVTGEHTWHNKERYFRHCEVIRAALTQSAPQASPAQRDFCPEKLKPGGCQLPNVHCGFPDCNKAPAAPLQAEPEASGNGEVTVCERDDCWLHEKCFGHCTRATTATPAAREAESGEAK